MESPDAFALLVDDIRAERLDVVAQFFQAEQAALLALEWDPGAERLDAPELRFLLDYWRHLRGTQSLPSAERVTPFELRPVLGHLVIVDALDEGRDGHYRLFGSKVAHRLGQDLTGRPVDAIDGGSYLGRFARALHRAMFLRPQPAFVAHQPPPSVSATAWQWLVLPLAGNGGDTVVRYLTGMVPMPARSMA